MIWLNFVGIVLTFLSALVGFIIVFRKQNAIHVLVDGNLSKVMIKLGISQARNTQLTETITDAGMDVPPKPEVKDDPNNGG